MRPFPLHGLVPMFKQMTRIEAVHKHPLLGETYVLHTKDKQRGLTIHYNMSREQIIEQIEEYAAFAVGQRITIERYGEMVVGYRRWRFKEGRAYYRIGKEREKMGSGWVAEERLKQLVEDASLRDREFDETLRDGLDVIF